MALASITEKPVVRRDGCRLDAMLECTVTSPSTDALLITSDRSLDRRELLVLLVSADCVLVLSDASPPVKRRVLELPMWVDVICAAGDNVAAAGVPCRTGVAYCEGVLVAVLIDASGALVVDGRRVGGWVTGGDCFLWLYTGMIEPVLWRLNCSWDGTRLSVA